MARKSRDYERILKGLKAMSQAVSDTKRACTVLNGGASSAQATLKDEAAEKNINKIQELASGIEKHCKNLEESISTMTDKVRKEKAEWDNLVGSVR